MFERLEDLVTNQNTTAIQSSRADTITSSDRAMRASIADRVSKALPFLGISAGGGQKVFLPNLRALYSPKDLEMSIKFYTNQEPFNPVTIIRNGSYSMMTKSGLLVRSEADGDESASPVSLSALLDNEADTGSSSCSSSSSSDYLCTNVLKKRRRKMRRHKHKKRLRENRYKAK